MDCHEFKTELTRLTAGLLYFSESEYPLELLDWGVKTDAEVKDFIAGLHGNQFQVQELTSQDFFSRYVNGLQASGDAQMDSMAARVEEVEKFINTHATWCRVYRCGRIEVGVYIVMILPTSLVLVLKTISVET
jgi:hypothetical protein